ncbi:aminotransferase class I/II-fold pyridoxal phosphate-dependent enzyme [Paenibacillus amylolyticus]|nr:aminotransferase class I/II-fold pyridoxal phosphate-dependent enzyme [Paenibacillus amylolyticus]
MEIKRRRLENGQPVIDLSVGTPNIPPAQHIITALCEAAADPANYIYAVNDQSELLQAASDWYKQRYEVELDPATEICSLLGSQEGLAHISLSIVDEGDLVLVPDPCYPVFVDGPLLAGAELYYMPQKEENGYVIQLQDIPEDIAHRAKFMLVSYPEQSDNRDGTGSVLSRPDCLCQEV